MPFSRLFALLVIISTVGSADAQQILNGGFENWEETSVGEEPIGWETNNVPNGISVTRTSDAFAGDFAVRIEAAFPTFEGDAPGTMSVTIPASGGIPTNLRVHIKFTDFTDTSQARIELMTYVEEATDIFGIWWQQEEIPDWTEIDLDLFYPVPPSTIDSVRIRFVSGSVPTGVGYEGNGVLYVDNLRLEGVNTSVQPVAAENPGISVYPNPVRDKLTVDLRQLPLGWYDILLQDISGRTVYQRRQAGNYALLHIPVSDLPAGTYFFTAIRDGARYHERVMVVGGR